MIMKKTLLLLALLPLAAFVSCNNSNTNTTQEEVCVFPNITEKGVEPFLIGSSLFDIPLKGAYYDTITLEKQIAIPMDEGLWIITEEEYDEMMKKYPNNELSDVKVTMYANVKKNANTLLYLKCGKDANIEGITVLSDNFKTDNGLHVGITTEELISNYNAKTECTYQHYGTGTILYNIPNFTNYIKFVANHSFTLLDGSCDWNGYNIESDTFIQDSIKDWAIGGILIHNKPIEKDYDIDSDLWDIVHLKSVD